MMMNSNVAVTRLLQAIAAFVLVVALMGHGSNAQGTADELNGVGYYGYPIAGGGGRPLYYYLEPSYGPLGRLDQAIRRQFKRTPAVKRERIIMDALGGDYLIKRKRSLLA